MRTVAHQDPLRPEGAGSSRRRVITTALWGAPAIVVATGAPTFAASEVEEVPPPNEPEP